MNAPASEYRAKFASGLRLMQEGKCREGEEVFRYLLAEAPADPDLLCALASAILGRGAAPEALDLLAQARSAYPNHAGILAALSATYRGLNEPAQAKICIDAAIALAPREVGHRLARVELLIAEGLFAEAFEEIETGLGLGGCEADLFNAKGLLLARRSETSASVKAFEAACAADPSRAETAHNLALALKEFGLTEKALAAAERAYLNEPSNALYRLNLARCQIMLGRLDKAKDLLQATLALSPHDIAVADTLASLMIAMGEADAALARLAGLVRQTRNAPEACLALAQNLRRAGRLHQALAAVAPARLVPATEVAAQQLETELRLALGQYEPLGEADVEEEDVREPSAFHVDIGRLGDAILAMRWLAPATRLHVPNALLGVFSAFGTATVTDERPAESAPILSLLRQEACRPREDQPAYLHPANQNIEPWRTALRQLPGPRIGLVWDHAPSGLRLERLLPALADAGTLISLAAAPLRHDLKEFPQVLDGGVNISSLDQLTAAIAALDCVVMGDCLAAHIAGALGKPGCVLLPIGHQWHWRAEAQRAVWYPSLDVIAQTSPGRWDDVFEGLQLWLRRIGQSADQTAGQSSGQGAIETLLPVDASP